MDIGLQFCLNISHVVHKFFGVRTIGTSSHPNGNGGVERANHTTAQMLATVVNELQNNWDEQLPHVKFAYNNSSSVTTGLAPNEVHMNRLPRLPSTICERTGIAGHHSLARDHFAYCDLAMTASSARTRSSVKTMPSQFIAWNAATQPAPTHCARFPNSRLAAGCRYTICLLYTSDAADE